MIGGARQGEHHQNVEALFIRDYFRRRLARFKLGAHFLDLSCLLFELRSENLHLFIRIVTASNVRGVNGARSAQPILRLEPDSGALSSEGISQIVWKRNGVSLRVQAKEPTRLVFAESAFPGWSVRVNGARAALGQNGPLMSVWLNAGESEVDWTYRPWWFVPGMLGWLIGTFFLLSTALPDRCRHLLRWKLRQQPDVHSNAMTQML